VQVSCSAAQPEKNKLQTYNTVVSAVVGREPAANSNDKAQLTNYVEPSQYEIYKAASQQLDRARAS